MPVDSDWKWSQLVNHIWGGRPDENWFRVFLKWYWYCVTGSDIDIDIDRQWSQLVNHIWRCRPEINQSMIIAYISYIIYHISYISYISVKWVGQSHLMGPTWYKSIHNYCLYIMYDISYISYMIYHISQWSQLVNHIWWSRPGINWYRVSSNLHNLCRCTKFKQNEICDGDLILKGAWTIHVSYETKSLAGQSLIEFISHEKGKIFQCLYP